MMIGSDAARIFPAGKLRRNRLSCEQNTRFYSLKQRIDISVLKINLLLTKFVTLKICRPGNERLVSTSVAPLKIGIQIKKNFFFFSVVVSWNKFIALKLYSHFRTKGNVH